MKKLLTLLVLTLITGVGAWAQTFYLKNGSNYVGIDGNLSLVNEGSKAICYFSTQSEGVFQARVGIATGNDQFLHIGSSKWSRGSASNLTLFKVSGNSATKVTAIEANAEYVVVGTNSSTTYAMKAENNSSTGGDRRLEWEAVSISNNAISDVSDVVKWTAVPVTFYEDQSQGSGIYGELTTDDLARMVEANGGSLKIVCRTVSGTSKDNWLGKTKVAASDYGQVNEEHVLVMEAVDGGYRLRTLAGEYFKGTSGSCQFTTTATDATTLTLRARGHSSDTNGVGADTAPYNNGKYHLVSFMKDSNFLNCNDTNSTPRWYSGTGGYSCYCVYAVTETQRAEITPVFVSTSDTRTTHNEYASKLVDGNTGTKWGIGYTNGTSQEWVVVKADNTVLKGYKLFNGGDTNSQQGRRWKNWTIEGSLNGTDWTLIQTKENVVMDPTNNGENSYSCNENTTPYSYYRVTVNNNMDGNMIQMSEMYLVVESVNLQTADVTYNYKLGDRIYKTVVVESQVVGMMAPVPATQKWLTFAESDYTLTEVQEGGTTIDVTCQENLPFEAASTFEGIQHWYFLDVHSSQHYYPSYEPDREDDISNVFLSQTKPTFINKNAAWAFVGNLMDGFKLYNYAGGKDLSLSENIASKLVANNDGYAFKLAESSVSGNQYFCLQKSSGNYINCNPHDANGNNNPAQRMNLNDWGSNDAGSTFKVEEVDVTAVPITIKYTTNKNHTWTRSNVAAHIGDNIDATYVAVDFYSNFVVVDDINVVSESKNTFNVTCDEAFPFIAGEAYTMHSAGNNNNYVCDGTNAWYNNSVEVESHNDLWVFEHVANTELFTVKNYGKNKYMTLSGEGRIAATFVDIPTTWGGGNSATSQFLITKNGNGFNIQHPNNTKINIGSHVDNKVGSWNGDDCATNNHSRNIVTPATPDWDGLQSVVDNAETYTLGEGLGKYRYMSESADKTETDYKPLLENIKSDLSGSRTSTFMKVEEYKENLSTMTNALTLNMPEPNTFLRMKGGKWGTYINGNVEAGQQVRVFNEAKYDASTIFFYNGSNLIGYSNGLGLTNTNYVASYGEGDEFTFCESPYAKGKYVIKHGNNALVEQTSAYLLNSGEATENSECNAWTIDALSSIPVTIGSTGFASFYTPVTIAVPSTVTPYVCHLDGENLAMYSCKQKTTIGTTEFVAIPANTAVILKGAASTYGFGITTDENVEEYTNNSFFGDVATKPFAEDYTYYSLQRDQSANDGTVGFFIKPSGNFKGFQAFLKTEKTQAVQRFNVTFDEDAVITGFANVLGTVNINIPAFDLSGRKVNANSHRGLYIMNGKKVIR